jgi:hypothetical protein
MNSVPRYQDQPELAASIAANPVFQNLQDEVTHERNIQAMKWEYTYSLNNFILGQASKPFTITIEQGTDFLCKSMTISAFGYDKNNPSSFPAVGNTSWAARGLTMRITDTRSGVELTSGDTPIELFATPGYGTSFVKPLPFRYTFLRNSKVRFDIRNNDNAAFNAALVVAQNGDIESTGEGHRFSIALHGFKYLTPGS